MDRITARPLFATASLAPAAIALCAGALNVFAFAPFGLWPLQIATLALVFRLVTLAPNARVAALLGWAYGTGWMLAGVHWLYISMNRYGGMPGWMAALAVLALAVSLGLFAALATGGARRLQQRWHVGSSGMLLLLLPAAWTLAEWLRGWILTGFPWLVSGYAHVDGPLAGFAPLVGVYGLAWIAALIAGSLALLPARRWPMALVVLLLATGWGLSSLQWTSPHGGPISVRLLQGNVSQDMKFQPRQIQATLSLYHEMIAGEAADLIATPETAIPLLSSQLPPDYLDQLEAFARATGSHLALGIPISDGPRQYANSVLGLAPEVTQARYRYDKHHLVPFGEFIPFGSRWFVNLMDIPLGDFTPGQLLQAPVGVADQWVLPNICFEDLFGEEIAAQLRAGGRGDMPEASVLLNVSNIAWFGESIAIPQHLQVSRMRALETGRPMLRATNTGATAVIGPRGQILAQLEPFQRGVLRAQVQGYAGLTPYVRMGNAPTVVLALGVLLLTCLMLGNNWPVKGKNR
jgi:apolipoprotein N-acyltransferase